MKRFCIITTVLFVVSLAAAYLINNIKTDKQIALIYQNGHLIEEVDLRSTEYKEINIDGNIIAVENGRVCMKEANCSDKLCVKQGWISDSIIPIVCLPNKIVIELSDKSANADAAVY